MEQARVIKASDTGRFSVVETECAAGKVKLLVGEGDEIPSGTAKLSFDAANTRIYTDGWLAGPETV